MEETRRARVGWCVGKGEVAVAGGQLVRKENP